MSDLLHFDVFEHGKTGMSVAACREIPQLTATATKGESLNDAITRAFAAFADANGLSSRKIVLEDSFESVGFKSLTVTARQLEAA